MPRSSGIYTAPASSWNPGTNAASATTADWNALLADLSAAITQSLAVDGQTTPTANLPMGGFKFTGLAAGTANGNSVRYEQLPSATNQLPWASTTGIAPRATRIDIASVAGTVDLTANAPNTDDIRITGTNAITAFTVASDRVLRVTANGAFTLTNNGSIVTQTGANIVASAGDTFSLRATAANVVEVLEFSPVKRQTLATAQNTTSGTSFDFTSIPAWVNRISVVLNGVSASGTDPLMLQIGAGSVTTSGYSSETAGGYSGNVISGTAFTTGFGLNNSSIAANANYCQAVLIRMTGNTWQYSSNMTTAVSQAGIFNGGGVIQLGGTLDRVRLTTLNGTDTFDAGSVNIMYE